MKEKEGRDTRLELTVAAVAASGPQAESSRILMLEVADPFRRDERDDTDDGVAYGEDAPQHPDRLGVADVVGRVHVGGFDVLYLGAHLGIVGSPIQSRLSRRTRSSGCRWRKLILLPRRSRSSRS